MFMETLIKAFPTPDLRCEAASSLAPGLLNSILLQNA